MRWSLRKHGVRRAITLTLSGLFLALAAYQFWGEHGYFALRTRLDEQHEWQQRNDALRRENDALEKRIHDLRTNPKVIEKIAREELMLARPDEKVILDTQKK